MENLKRVERAQRFHIERISRKLPHRQVRVCGTMAAIEVSTHEDRYASEFSNRVTEAALARNVFARPLGNVVYLLPPYCATDAEIADAWDVLAEAVEEAFERSGLEMA